MVASPQKCLVLDGSITTEVLCAELLMPDWLLIGLWIGLWCFCFLINSGILDFGVLFPHQFWCCVLHCWCLHLSGWLLAWIGCWSEWSAWQQRLAQASCCSDVWFVDWILVFLGRQWDTWKLNCWSGAGFGLLLCVDIGSQGNWYWCWCLFSWGFFIFWWRFVSELEVECLGSSLVACNRCSVRCRGSLVFYSTTITLLLILCLPI